MRLLSAAALLLAAGCGIDREAVVGAYVFTPGAGDDVLRVHADSSYERILIGAEGPMIQRGGWELERGKGGTFLVLHGFLPATPAGEGGTWRAPVRRGSSGELRLLLDEEGSRYYRRVELRR